MTSVSVISILFFAFLTIYSVAAASFDQVAELKGELKTMVNGMKSIPNISSRDYKSIVSYATKMVESIESELSSSKPKLSELKSAHQKAFEKSASKIQESEDMRPEIQVTLFELASEFFNKVSEILELDSEGQGAKVTKFMTKLAEMPEGSIAAHYLNFLRTLDNLETADFGSGANKVVMLDTAVEEFCRNFVGAYNRDFAIETHDEIVNQCLMAGITSKFNEITSKFEEIAPRTSASDQSAAARLISDDF